MGQIYSQGYVKDENRDSEILDASEITEREEIVSRVRSIVTHQQQESPEKDTADAGAPAAGDSAAAASHDTTAAAAGHDAHAEGGHAEGGHEAPKH